ncbi:MAG: LLM class flavin-dependent oxidoreductase [Pseudomonadales bacterium]
MSLHIGVTPWLLHAQTNAKALSLQAQQAESLGYESFWLPENHFTNGVAIPDPLMLLASVAAATDSIRLATTSYLLPLRHPLQAAEQVAVLDRLSGGRVILGVGRGYQPAMFAAFNVTLKDKRSLFAECLTLMQNAWSGAAVGEDANGKEIALAPLPIQQPHPPIWIAAFGPKALAQAGRLGLPYLASPMETLAVLRENYQAYTDACRGEGNHLPNEVPVMRSVFVSRDGGKIRAVKRLLTEHKPMAELRTGTTSDVAEGALIGDPFEVVDAVQRYRAELGMTHLIATTLRIHGVDASDRETSVKLLAETMNGSG